MAPPPSIDASTELIGNLSCSETVRIDGKLKGKLTCEKLTGKHYLTVDNQENITRYDLLLNKKKAPFGVVTADIKNQLGMNPEGSLV